MLQSRHGAVLAAVLGGLIAGALVAATVAAAPPADDATAAARARMVAAIEANAADVGIVAGRSGISAAVLEVMGRIPRHLFVPEDRVRHAYEDRPLPIGYGQTISQPYIVALMTDLLAVGADDTVLEIGTGSGYQAAVLSPLARHVYTIEIVPALADAAGERLRRLGYDNVTLRQGDGYDGWPEHAPFDRIVVTAAAGHVPPPLIQQMAAGGRMIIPVGSPFLVQQLVMVDKHADGTVTSRHLLPVRFVPLTGGR
ncbi:MAG: protein-L-isoaspartate(D-aspartate) O-methyltransferase [Rhodospirillales bacterium]